MALLWAGLIAAGGAAGSTVPSGLYGTVTRGPITPVCRVGVPCTAPAANTTLVFSRPGHPQVRVRTHQDGTYRIALPGGTYTVRVATARPLQPGKAWVRSGHYRHVDFSIDTGIR